MIGQAGLEVTAGLGQVIGTRQFVFIEGTGLVDNHSIVKLSDSLALYRLFETLDPALTQEQTKAILDAVSSQGQDSLENALDTLRTIVFGHDVAPTQITDDTGAAARNDYYSNLQTLSASSEFGSIVGSAAVIPLTDKSPSAIHSLAQGDIAYRYALKELNPFAVLGVDYSRFNTAGELDLIAPATATGNLSDKWLEDRAALLAWANRARREDTAFSASARPTATSGTTRPTTRIKAYSSAPRTFSPIRIMSPLIRITTAT
jgi:hypothetical protein